MGQKGELRTLNTEYINVHGQCCWSFIPKTQVPCFKSPSKRPNMSNFSHLVLLLSLLSFLPDQCYSHCTWCQQFKNGPVTQNGTYQVIVGQNPSLDPATQCTKMVNLFVAVDFLVFIRHLRKLLVKALMFP